MKISFKTYQHPVIPAKSVTTRFRRNLRRLQSRQGLRLVLPTAFVAVLVSSVMLTQFVDLPSFGSERSPAEAAADYQKSLREQVDEQDGSPTSGRDPSTQSQTSLADAAAAPTGTSTRTDTPAAGLTGDHQSAGHHSAGSSHMPGTAAERQASGINSAGCFYDYGTPGSQCVGAYLAGDDGVLQCREVRSRFTQGVKVSGNDRFKLDSNGDGVACGPND